MTKKLQTEEEKKAQELVEATAQALIDLAEGVRKVLGGKLKKEAIVILLQDAMGGRGSVSKQFISDMLETMAKLDKRYLK